MTKRTEFEAHCLHYNPRYDKSDDSIQNRIDWRTWQAAWHACLLSLDPPVWDEARIDVIGQNGNTGEHYEP